MADTVISRLVGLLNRTAIGPREGLVITHCRSIHMLFMRFAIDVIFVDKRNCVVGLVEDIRPFRFSPYFFRAHCAIEVSPGTIARSKTALGDVLEMPLPQ